MTTTSFRRHHKACLDATVHHTFSQLGNRHGVRKAFGSLLFTAYQRSDLMDAAPVLRAGVPHFPQLDALVNLARFHGGTTRALADWPGAHGHPLFVVDSLARHLHARYRTPRFLASVWFGGGTAAEQHRREWFLMHAQGVRFRGLRLPLIMTRRMEHIFLRTPDHLPFDTALRRAEVLGLGGSPALVDAVVATPLGRDFSHNAYTREVVAWLVRREDELAPGDVALLVEHLMIFAAANPPPSLIGRTVASVKRDDAERRRPPRRTRAHAPVRPRPMLTWPKSQWHDERLGEWNIVELLSTEHLLDEGRTLRHCVGNYDWRCHARASTIWSLRREDQPVLTIEVDPKEGTITMVRGLANRQANEHELGLVCTWAARQGLRAAGDHARQLESRAGPRPA